MDAATSGSTHSKPLVTKSKKGAAKYIPFNAMQPAQKRSLKAARELWQHLLAFVNWYSNIITIGKLAIVNISVCNALLIGSGAMSAVFLGVKRGRCF